MDSVPGMSPSEAVRCARMIAEAAWPVAWSELPKLLGSMGWVGRVDKPQIFHTGSHVGSPTGFALPVELGVVGSVNFALNERVEVAPGTGDETRMVRSLEELRNAVFVGLVELWGPPIVEVDEPGERRSKWALENGAEVELHRLKRTCGVTVRSPQAVAFVETEEQYI